MRAVRHVEYIANDGTKFPTLAAAKEYEAKNVGKALVGLKHPQLLACLDPQNDKEQALAEAVEDFGRRVRDARLKRGEYKRAPNPLPADQSAPAAVAEGDGEGEE